MAEHLKMSLYLALVSLIIFAIPNEGKPQFPLLYSPYIPSYPRINIIPYQFAYAYSYPIKSASHNETQVSGHAKTTVQPYFIQGSGGRCKTAAMNEMIARK